MEHVANYKLHAIKYLDSMIKTKGSYNIEQGCHLMHFDFFSIILRINFVFALQLQTNVTTVFLRDYHTTVKFKILDFSKCNGNINLIKTLFQFH